MKKLKNYKKKLIKEIVGFVQKGKDMMPKMEGIMKKMKQEIPIFFSTDDNYIPCLSVAIHSLKENSSNENNYRIIILHTGMSLRGKAEVKKLEDENVKISFQNISHITTKLSKELALRLRDYYSETIYYRMFIPSMFPEYEKAIYLDADIVLQDDVAKLYDLDLGDNLIAGVTDMVINSSKEFKDYSKYGLGIEPEKYFNSGVLVMNLREMRKAKIEEKFLYRLLNYNLDTAAPDQDYLNTLCKDRVLYLPETWNKMPDFGKKYNVNELHLIHYNMYRKPWHYSDVPYSEVFWNYAKETKYYDELKETLTNYPEEAKKQDLVAGEKLVEYTKQIVKQEFKFADIEDDLEDDDESQDTMVETNELV